MTKLRPGDRVRVPGGLGETDGTVVDFFGPPAAPFAIVRVELPGTGEPPDVEELSFRADILTPADGVTHT